MKKFIPRGSSAMVHSAHALIEGTAYELWYLDSHNKYHSFSSQRPRSKRWNLDELGMKTIVRAINACVVDAQSVVGGVDYSGQLLVSIPDGSDPDSTLPSQSQPWKCINVPHQEKGFIDPLLENSDNVADPVYTGKIVRWTLYATPVAATGIYSEYMDLGQYDPDLRLAVINGWSVKMFYVIWRAYAFYISPTDKTYHDKFGVNVFTFPAVDPALVQVRKYTGAAYPWRYYSAASYVNTKLMRPSREMIEAAKTSATEVDLAREHKVAWLCGISQYVSDSTVGGLHLYYQINPGKTMGSSPPGLRFWNTNQVTIPIDYQIY